MLQGLACFYYLLFYLVALAILLPAYLLAYPEHRTARSIAWVVGTGLAVGAVLATVAIPILLLYRHYGFTSEPSSYDLVGYLLPRSKTLLYGWMDVSRRNVDHFLGYLGLPVALYGLWRMKLEGSRERTLGLAYLGVAVVGLLLSAGPSLAVAGVLLGPGPYALVDGIGPFQNLRTPDRFSLLVTLGLALFVARGAAGAVASLGARRGWGLAIVLGLLFLAEHWSPDRVQGVEVPAGETIPDVYPWLAASGNAGIVAELPVRPFRQVRLLAHEAYYASLHGGTVLFNKPSFYPPGDGTAPMGARELSFSGIGDAPASPRCGPRGRPSEAMGAGPAAAGRASGRSREPSPTSTSSAPSRTGRSPCGSVTTSAPSDSTSSRPWRPRAHRSLVIAPRSRAAR